MKRLFFLAAALLSMPLLAQEQYNGIPVTVAEFVRLSPEDTTQCLVSGVVTRVSSVSGGNFYVKDDSGELYIYGIVDPSHPGWGLRQIDIKAGDTVSLSGRRRDYHGTPEMVSARLVSKVNGPDHDAPIKYDRDPSFKGKTGGDAIVAFSQWVQKQIRRPQGTEDVHGEVTVRFVVGRNGGVQEVQAEKGLTTELNDEAVRVVQSSPKWKPAVLDGNTVRTVHHLRVEF